MNNLNYFKISGSAFSMSLSDREQAGTLYISYDQKEWEPWNGNTTQITPSQNEEAVIYIRGTRQGTGRFGNFHLKQDDTADLTISGNIEILADYEKAEQGIPVPLMASEFSSLFAGCKTITDASSLVLPAQELSDHCYESMFFRCTGLIHAPELPAKKLAKFCYRAMFCLCSSLKQPPDLPACEMEEQCYTCMFELCTSLMEPPALPSRKLAKSCYSSMFLFCESLRSCPELPATALEENCYANMFSKTGFSVPPALPARILAKGCYMGMFSYSPNLNTAPDLPAEDLKENCYLGMFKSCPGIIHAPDLSFCSWESGCYNSMFSDCRNLQVTKTLFALSRMDCVYTLFMILSCDIPRNIDADEPIDNSGPWFIKSLSGLSDDTIRLILNNREDLYTRYESKLKQQGLTGEELRVLFDEVQPDSNSDYRGYSRPLIEDYQKAGIPDPDFEVWKYLYWEKRS